MRIIFIPGFCEEPWIFDKIHPHLTGEKVFVDNWRLLENHSQHALTPLIYARKIIELYKITQHHLVVGHSMGGWLALHIKHLQHCPIVQIAS
ncbi:MAG: alpha/beta hydrolase [Bacteroidetes bacterium]|nr:alpha/beta hydrolase [Bacteroidota bacterium]